MPFSFNFRTLFAAIGPYLLFCQGLIFLKPCRCHYLQSSMNNAQSKSALQMFSERLMQHQTCSTFAQRLYFLTESTFKRARSFQHRSRSSRVTGVLLSPCTASFKHSTKRYAQLAIFFQFSKWDEKVGRRYRNRFARGQDKISNSSRTAEIKNGMQFFEFLLVLVGYENKARLETENDTSTI